MLDIVAILVLCLVGTFYARRKKSLYPLPPGPKGYPVIGNALDMPKSHEWIAYEKWVKELGSDIVHAEVLGTHIIILNSEKAAKELFERRSSLYSDRPPLVALNVLLNFDWTMAFSRYGQRWRNMRRESHRYLHPAATLEFRSIQLKATRQLLQRLLEAPKDFMTHIRHMTGQTIFEVAYGIDVQPKNDPYIGSAEESLKAMTLGCTPGAGIFDTFPFLAKLPTWIPGSSFRKEAEDCAMSAPRGLEIPFRAAKGATVSQDSPYRNIYSSGTLVSSNPIDEWDGNPIYRVTYDPATTHGGGRCCLVQTASSIETFFLAMVLYPEVQKQAQAEIDRVVGTDRLPDFTDEAALPYIGALVKEVFRWHPAVPLAIPHRVVCDDVYDGYFIPAGSVVIGNSWAILHDETVFPEPGRFKPERFLTADSKPNGAPFPDAVFGFGRRICPGRYMAREAVWIAVVSVLARFNISKALDEDGNEVETTDKYASGFISHPLPFQCRIQLRHAHRPTL
ncbi:cytochrome P450 monooxygenase 3 [Heterobasidion irregulare TC 32-1]|uniref:Cytochrome P450 monooxygenase 3 n=1 Tax=Heterobasidion irregulare (strain TC 32-1) TaxID=747525 RepID=W4K0F8_HETIT|nr:cytochrome P450 monooxygenase 3 [Heterobasidion irregulare TC 32-1]ETW78616.1 cytochrome P450 monooxygenase 3 [Heterobasidion irregulare TC 32-1]